MDFSHSDDRRMLADTLERFVASNAGWQKRAAATKSAPGYDAALWAQYAELGVIGALFTPEQGGFGGAGFDVMVVFEALGSGLVGEPFLTALMSGRALAAAGGREREIEAIVDGSKVIAFAHQEGAGSYDLDTVTTTARADGAGWVLNGAKTVIHDAEGATALLVSARSAGSDNDAAGVSLFLVPAGTPGLTINGYQCVDGGRAAEIVLKDVKLDGAALVGAAGAGSAAIRAAVDAGLLALSAEALGAMGVVRDATLEYLRTRVQFGEPIGRNQALQHRMASVLVEIEQARSAVINAAAALDGAADVRERILSGTKYTIGKTGAYVAEEAIQLHGGIGMTWELPMTHFAKRLVMINHQLGDDDHHLMRYAALGRAA